MTRARSHSSESPPKVGGDSLLLGVVCGRFGAPQKADSGTSMRSLSVASAMARSAAILGRTFLA